MNIYFSPFVFHLIPQIGSFEKAILKVGGQSIYIIIGWAYSPEV